MCVVYVAAEPCHGEDEESFWAPLTFAAHNMYDLEAQTIRSRCPTKLLCPGSPKTKCARENTWLMTDR